MGDLQTHLELIYQHWRMAMIQGGVFFIGIFSAGIVLKYRLSFLMRMPLWMIDRIMRFLATHENPFFIFAFIASFNSIAILVYMSTGAISCALPTAICFLTGMNIGIVAGAMPVLINAAQKQRALNGRMKSNELKESRTRLLLRTLGGVIVASLELPALWFSIAMGTTLQMNLFDPSFGPEVLAGRVSAYMSIIVPVLIISAAVETVVIKLSMTTEIPPWGGDDK